MLEALAIFSFILSALVWEDSWQRYVTDYGNYEFSLNSKHLLCLSRLYFC